MRRHNLVHQLCQRLHLSQRFEAGHGGFDMIEQMMKHRVFGPQNTCDLHDPHDQSK